MEEQKKISDHENSARIFARVIGMTLKENTGIVVDIVEDVVFNPRGDAKKIIIINKNNYIIIDNFDQDLPEGTLCNIVDENENKEDTTDVEDAQIVEEPKVESAE